MKPYQKILISINIASIVVSFSAEMYYVPTLNIETSIYLFSINLICIIIFISSMITYIYTDKDFLYMKKFLTISFSIVAIYVIVSLSGLINHLAYYFYCS